jgi:hypothetical protein
LDKSSEKPTHFTIEFKTKDSKPATYEAPNHAIARTYTFLSLYFILSYLTRYIYFSNYWLVSSGEIVSKIQYLINMETKGGTNK